MSNSKLRLLIIFSFFSLLSGCATNDAPDFQTMIIRLSDNYPAIWQLITSVAYVGGFLLAMKAVYLLKAYGEARTMMSSHTSLKGPVVYLMVASALMFTPAAFHTISVTAFGYSDPTPLSYATSATAWSPQAIWALLGFVQLFGLFAFIRGWFYIARIGDQNSQPGTFARGLTHIVGGLLAINIVGAWEIIKTTVGW